MDLFFLKFGTIHTQYIKDSPDHLRDWMCVRAEWETAPLRLRPLSPPHTFMTILCIKKSHSNIFINMPEMGGFIHTYKEYLQNLRGILDMALHHTCMRVQSNAARSRSTWPLPEHKSQHLCTLYQLTAHLWSPARPRSPREVLWPVKTRVGHMNVLKLFVQSNWTAQCGTNSHRMPRLWASRHNHTRQHWAMWRAQDAGPTGCPMSRLGKLEFTGLHCMVLHLQTFLDCNTRQRWM